MTWTSLSIAFSVLSWALFLLYFLLSSPRLPRVRRARQRTTSETIAEVSRARQRHPSWLAAGCN
jgi:hypothetical protein